MEAAKSYGSAVAEPAEARVYRVGSSERQEGTAVLVYIPRVSGTSQ